MNNILILINTFLPGKNSGGPLRTIANLVDLLGDEFNFYVLCECHDFKSTENYADIRLNEWNDVGKAKVWYYKKLTLKLIKEISKGMDLIYACSLFSSSSYKALIAKKMRKIKIPVVIAPMGVFSQGAFNQKNLKKTIFVNFFRCFGFFKDIKWSVTSEIEANDLKKHVGKKIDYCVAEDPPRNTVPGIGNKNINDNKIIFLSRICRQKNLLGAIKALSHVNSNVIFDIYGPKEDKEYWDECEKELALLPANVKWGYRGEVDSNEVQSVFQQYNMFILPTLSENYGHVIFESLSAGCIPVISDTTPWRQLEDRNCGYINRLSDNLDDFSNSIENFVHLSNVEREEKMNNAIKLAKEKIEDARKKSGYKRIFEGGLK